MAGMVNCLSKLLLADQRGFADPAAVLLKRVLSKTST